LLEKQLPETTSDGNGNAIVLRRYFQAPLYTANPLRRLEKAKKVSQTIA